MTTHVDNAIVKPLHAVITGDIVASSQLESEERARLPELLRAAYRTIQDHLQANVLYPIDLFGGDSWQIYLPEPAQALAVAINFRAALYADSGITTRLSLAVDTIDFLNTEKPSESDGPAFRRSGRALKQPRSPETVISLPESADPNAQIVADLIARIVNHVSRTWTRAQARAVALATGGLLAQEQWSQARIGDAWTPWPISQQAVARHLQSAGWDVLEPTIHDFSRIIEDITPQA